MENITADKSDLLEKIIEKIIEKAIEKYDKKKTKERKQLGYERTKQLMKSYPRLRDHIKYGISNMNDLQKIVDIDFKVNECDDIFILSILQSKLKTEMMMSHINIALGLLKESERKEGNLNKYRAFEMHYVNNDRKSYESICDELGCSKNRPKIWCDEMMEKLSEYLWGLDGIKDFIW